MAHPAEVNHALHLAWTQMNKLIGDAEKRGDEPGAAAWKEALAAIEAAEDASRKAREAQNWARRKP